MTKSAVLLLCAACGGIAWQNPQNRPKLSGVVSGESVESRNLAGFRPIHTFWPTVTTNWPNGRRISVNALVADGKAYGFTVISDADPSIAKPFLSALKRWRFSMPRDGTSPVRLTVTWEALDGRFFTQNIEMSLR